MEVVSNQRKCLIKKNTECQKRKNCLALKTNKKNKQVKTCKLTMLLR